MTWATPKVMAMKLASLKNCIVEWLFKEYQGCFDWVLMDRGC